MYIRSAYTTATSIFNTWLDLEVTTQTIILSQCLVPEVIQHEITIKEQKDNSLGEEKDTKRILIWEISVQWRKNMIWVMKRFNYKVQKAQRKISKKLKSMWLGNEKKVKDKGVGG